MDVGTLEDRVTPATVFALSGTNLLSFDSASPTITQSTPISGVTGGETLVGIDFRPQNGLLYGLGVNASLDTATLYAISTRTGVAGVVGTPSSIAFTTNGTTAVDLPDPTTVGYGFDFNPSADRIRVVAGTLNFRVNPNTGLGVDGDNTGLTSTPGNGANPDAPITGTTNADAAAYTNAQPNNGNVTTLYTLDAVGNRLLRSGPPNQGVQTQVAGITLNGNPLDFTVINGFDIPAGVNALADDAPVVSGSGFAVFNVGGTTSVYTINLLTGAATFVGNVGNGSTAVQGMAVQSDLGGIPAVALTAGGVSLLRFNTATPGTVTTVTLGAPASGEQLVAIDFRPATGQLYGLGVNSTADAATLYLIDPQLGGLTAVAAGAIAFQDANGVTIQLPDPTTTGYGMDFNPTVDRLRVTTGSGLNFRVNPISGEEIDGNFNNGTQNNTNPDGNINIPGGTVTGITATAYTNSFGTGGSPTTPAGFTTQYTLDAITNSLYIQTQPNSGTQTSPLGITLDGDPLDFTEVSGFDIPAGVRVGTSNAAATSGFGYAVLTVSGTTRLYQIDLTTGVATTLGTVGAGATGLAGLSLADAPAGTVSFSSITPSLAEGADGPLVINLTRTGGSVGNLTVTVNVTGGSGTAGSDFTAGPYTATFADGATTASINIAITDDAFIEDDQTIILTIASVDNAGVIGAPNVATVTIVDNDEWNPVALDEPLSTTGFVYSANPDEALVQDIYRTLLGRQADSAGLAGWVSAFQSTGSAQVVIDGIFDSSEHRTRQVTNFYDQILGRSGAPSEIQAWVDLIGSGLTEAQVIAAFLASDEFAGTKTDSQYIESVYVVLLQRPADAPSLQGWLDNLNNGGTRADIVSGILFSAEYAGNAVTDFYGSYLVRAADPVGFNGWVQFYTSGGSETDIAKAFLGSQEFEDLMRQ